MKFSSKMIGILNNMIMNQCIINHHHDIIVLLFGREERDWGLGYARYRPSSTEFLCCQG